MIVTLASVVYAAFRAGSNTNLFLLDGSDDGEPLSQVRCAAMCRALGEGGGACVLVIQPASQEERSLCLSGHRGAHARGRPMRPSDVMPYWWGA